MIIIIILILNDIIAQFQQYSGIDPQMIESLFLKEFDDLVDFKEWFDFEILVELEEESKLHEGFFED